MERGRMTGGRAGLAALVLLAGSCAAKAQQPPTVPAAAPAVPAAPATPPSGLAAWLDPSKAPFIPVPEIDTDPQSGLTVGLIGIVLRTNEREEIERILAPDIIHSQYFGWGGRMRLFGYPSEDTQWSVVGGGKERVEREFDGRYLTGQTRSGALTWAVEAIYDRSGTPRFFGLGNNSSFTNETTYVNNQGLVDVSLGRNFTPALQLAYAVRWHYVDVLPGVLPHVPSIETVYPGLNGLGSEHILQQTLTLTWDTRDSANIPRSGARYLLYGGFVSEALGSSASYSYLGAEARCYWTPVSTVTLTWHATARYMPSAADAPFWALSSLGGDRSVTNEREPLRSNGNDRWVDRNLFATGGEIRARVAGFNGFGTHVSLELTPFVDAGKVFYNPGTSPFSQLHSAVGLGVRAVASPFIVGYVDVGHGHGRTAIFSGINYPF